MVRFSRSQVFLPIAFLAWALTGCAETKLAVNTAKIATRPDGETAYPYKIGKPYQVKGVWYYPKVDYNYDETGIASWYGPNFHERKTANGEIYDQNALTAAHKTLPMPSLVTVTNLENGRSIQVRINDRGPFANNRIIDLSYRTAQLLAMDKKGTARVRVQILEQESRAFAQAGGEKGKEPGQTVPQAAPAGTVTAEALPPPSNQTKPVSAEPDGTQPPLQEASYPLYSQALPEPDGTVKIEPVHATNIFIQAGSFLQMANARSLKSQLSYIGSANIQEAWVGNQKYYRVRVGPIASVEEADRILQDIINHGTSNAKIVVD